ncbi:MAG: methyltransferase domain-containing protein [Methylococcaceae bacterium]|nr:methyltransferase domain-containing protein [Methylococcaceae bacterium]
MNEEDLLGSKWNYIYSQTKTEPAQAADVLIENAHLLPETGTALDLACGLGGNAIFLAQQGLAVTAWDISSIAIEWVLAYAKREGLNINACQHNITRLSLPKCSYNIIAVSRFLDRTLSDAIIDALKPGGLLFYQTFTVEKIGRVGPTNPAFLLERNEILRLFSPLAVIFYRENSLCGNLQKGIRNEMQFIGQNID